MLISILAKKNETFTLAIFGYKNFYLLFHLWPQTGFDLICAVLNSYLKMNMNKTMNSEYSLANLHIY